MMSVICPQCSAVFATQHLAYMSSITVDSPVEADLHRVLPHPAARAALVAMCPNCIYTWWISSFAPHHFVPDLVPEAPEVEFSKKFAHAVLSGRNSGAHALDRALLAMNGLWCAREYGDSASADTVHKFLELSYTELHTALSDEAWEGNRSRYTYLLAEICRQLGQFASALELFRQVDRKALLPRELIDQQAALALMQDVRPVLLTPQLVEQIFRPKKEIAQPVIEEAVEEVTPEQALEEGLAEELKARGIPIMQKPQAQDIQQNQQQAPTFTRVTSSTIRQAS